LSKKYISKSMILRGIRCPKALYLQINRPELASDSSSSDESVRQMGTDIGILARKLFPSGVLIEAVGSELSLAETAEKSANPIMFESAFAAGDLVFRPDISERNLDGSFSITEVKASTSIKEYQIMDLAIQGYILDAGGHKIRALNLCYINKDYTNASPLRDMFIIEDKTQEAMLLFPRIAASISSIRDALTVNPECKIGPHCNKSAKTGSECPFKKYCFTLAGVPKLSVLNIPGLMQKWKLFDSGKIELNQLEAADMATPRQVKYLKRYQDQSPTIDVQDIAQLIRSWTTPLYFLDFETVAFAHPIFQDTKPFDDIPFQFSCFSIKGEANTLAREASYLASGLDSDPRPALIEALISSVGDCGLIVAYNSSFESSAIKQMAESFPSYASKLLAIEQRLVDLLPIMRDHVYFKEFYGNWSIKSVTPALFGESSSYSNLAIKDGLAAQSAFVDAVASNKLAEIAPMLREYCDKDVMEMVRIFLFLKNKITSSETA
jgi:hypothetical protein